MSLLEVNGLNVSFDTPDGSLRAVRDLSFSLERGETLGIVGESGSGKSVSVQTILGLTRGASVRISGEARFEGEDLLRMPPAKLRELRGARIGMIFQDPLSSLHPYYKVGWQIVELLRAHDRSVDRHAARRRAIELLDLVGIPEPSRRIDDYPHQFSGGMRQRVMIAMSMALNPSLLIADEPTTALDVTVQAQILAVLSDLQRSFAMAIILITHDLGVIAQVADDVVVMYAGSVMERAARREIFYDGRHPYTMGLLRSLPSYEELDVAREPSSSATTSATAAGTNPSSVVVVDSRSDVTRTAPGDVVNEFARRHLYSIPGQPPSLLGWMPGCPFTPRCPFRMERCERERPPLFTIARERVVGISDQSVRADVGGPAESADDRRRTHISACWLEARDELAPIGYRGGAGDAGDESRSVPPGSSHG
jgi:peptide/nickel transport system ATP-binding protein